MPAPRKREDELQRPRSRAGRPDDMVTRGEAMPVTIPAASGKWHPIAKRMFKSLRESGQSAFFQNSDWALAYSLCDDLSRYKRQEDRADEIQRRMDEWDERFAAGEDKETLGPRPSPFKGGSAMKLVTIMDGLSDLMVSEGARRKLRLELHEAEVEETPAGVTAIDAYRKALAGPTL